VHPATTRTNNRQIMMPRICEVFMVKAMR